MWGGMKSVVQIRVSFSFTLRKIFLYNFFTLKIVGYLVWGSYCVSIRPVDVVWTAPYSSVTFIAKGWLEPGDLMKCWDMDDVGVECQELGRGTLSRVAGCWFRDQGHLKYFVRHCLHCLFLLAWYVQHCGYGLVVRKGSTKLRTGPVPHWCWQACKESGVTWVTRVQLQYPGHCPNCPDLRSCEAIYEYKTARFTSRCQTLTRLIPCSCLRCLNKLPLRDPIHYSLPALTVTLESLIPSSRPQVVHTPEPQSVVVSQLSTGLLCSS